MKEGKTPITANVVAAIHLPRPTCVDASNGDDMGAVMVFLADGRCYEIHDVGKHLLGESQWKRASCAWYPRIAARTAFGQE